MRKSHLHAVVTHDDEAGCWRSLPPHEPRHDGECPQTPDEPCQHKHGSMGAALRCSRDREVHH